MGMGQGEWVKGRESALGGSCSFGPAAAGLRPAAACGCAHFLYRSRCRAAARLSCYSPIGAREYLWLVSRKLLLSSSISSGNSSGSALGQIISSIVGTGGFTLYGLTLAVNAPSPSLWTVRLARNSRW